MTLLTEPTHTGPNDASRPDRGPGEGSPTSRPTPSATIAETVSIGAVVFAGAIFGVFYAWVCTTMWGLDNADPRIAIEAMQEMNGAIRNAVFFPAFFLTPVVLGIAAALLRSSGRMSASRWFGAAAIVYLLGGLVLTMSINVPMNEDLAGVVVPAGRAEAEQIWADYSGRWQFWNLVRTIACGVSLTLAAIGVLRARR